MTEAEKRNHRCCFAGHRPKKLKADEQQIRAWLEDQLDEAVAAGCTTFITGMAMGVDIWAGLMVAERKKSDTRLKLIAAVPYPGFDRRWHAGWQRQYEQLLASADLVRTISPCYRDDAFERRNRWMVDHSARMICYASGEDGGTRRMTEYARQSGLAVCCVEENHGTTVDV